MLTSTSTSTSASARAKRQRAIRRREQTNQRAAIAVVALINSAQRSAAVARPKMQIEDKKNKFRFADGSSFSRWSNDAFDASAAASDGGSSAAAAAVASRDLFASGAF